MEAGQIVPGELWVCRATAGSRGGRGGGITYCAISRGLRRVAGEIAGATEVASSPRTLGTLLMKGARGNGIPIKCENKLGGGGLRINS